MSQAADQVQQRVQQALRDFETLSVADEPPSQVLKQICQALAQATASIGVTAWMPSGPSSQPSSSTSAASPLDAPAPLEKNFQPIARVGPGSAMTMTKEGRPLPPVLTVLQQTFAQVKAAIAAPDQVEFQSTELHHTTQFFVPVDAMGRTLGVIHLVSPAELDPKTYRQYVAFAQQGARSAGMYLARRQNKVLQEDAASSAALLRAVHKLFGLKDPGEVLSELSNQARVLLGAQRVATVGYWGRAHVAFSDVIEVDRKAVLVRAVEMIADTVRTRQVPMSFSKGQKLEDEDDVALEPLLDQLFGLSGAQALCFTPLRSGSEIVGVMLAEYALPDDASRHGGSQLEFCQQAGPILDQAIRWHERPLRRTSETLAKLREKPLTAASKAALAIGLAAAAVYGLFFMPVPMVVRGDARLEPAYTASMAAPFTGRVAKMLAATGQAVHVGDPLLQLDTTDLQLERARSVSALDGENVEAQASRTKGDRAALRSSELRSQQLQIHLQMLDRQIADATVKSLVDGVVLTERPQSLEGRTVAEGEELVRVADLKRFDLIVDLREEDVSLVEESLRAGRQVPVTFLSRPWPDLDQHGVVTDLLSLSPSSAPDEFRKVHVFHVTVPMTLSNLSPQLALANPSGRARLDVGNASVAERYGRRLWRFVQMTVLF
jgi:multidrug resistance efflux pump